MSRFLPLNSHCLDISLSSACSFEFCSSERVIGWIFTTNGFLSSVGSSLIKSRQFNRTWFERRKNCFLSIYAIPIISLILATPFLDTSGLITFGFCSNNSGISGNSNPVFTFSATSARIFGIAFWQSSHFFLP